MTEQTDIKIVNPLRCPHMRCAAPVIQVQLGPNLARTLVDYKPATWQDGGRVKLSEITSPDGEPPMARRLVHAGQAFGTVLYRLHTETCKVAQKRTRTKATSS